MNPDIKIHIQKLYTNYFKEEPLKIEQLAASGSSRKYYSIRSAHHYALVAHNDDYKENVAFVKFTQHFIKNKLPVPEILCEDLENNIYMLTDLGDETLFLYLENHRDEGFTEKTILLYKEAITQLQRFQIDAGSDIDYSVCYPRDKFDKQSMMWDLNYFKYYFLKLAHINFDEQRLEDDFNTFSNYLLKTNCNYFLYRDFQSRNIMIHKGRLFFIDYQGGRKGALQYDIASLLYDAKADIPQNVRELLLEHYISLLVQKVDMDANEFRHYFYGYALIRIMQAMGAYGYRGYYEKKQHFLKSIPFAVGNLKWITENITLPIDIPALNNVFKEIILSENLRSFEMPATDMLTVSISSFSFKKGYPEDKTGNGGGFVFDCRALPNPGRFENYKLQTGKDAEVKNFLEQYKEVEDFFENTSQLVCQSINTYMERGFTSLEVSYGCTGGQHRSVYFAERLAKYIEERFNVNIRLKHQETK